MVNDLAVVNQLTTVFIEDLIYRFCSIPGDRNCGGFVDPNLQYADSRNSIYDAQTLFAAYLYPDFPRYHRDPEMLRRLLLHVDFMHRRQYPDGSVGLGAAGVGSGSEVGFTLPGVCMTYARLTATDVPGRDSLLDSLKSYIDKGARCVRNQFPHTSNHRWTACAGPLAIVDRLFPDPANRAIIDEYLSDGIDIDTDGLFYEERSPNYNIVAQWGLLFLVDYYGRRDLLKLVERSLRHCLRMRQPNDEAETLFSHRQDRGKAGSEWGDYYVFKRLAVETGDPEFAWAADHLRDRMIRKGHLQQAIVPLRYASDDPRLIQDSVPRTPPSKIVRYAFQDSPIWRYRDGQTAATVAADAGGHFFDITQGTWGGQVRSDAFFSCHSGSAIIDAIKIRWGSGTGGFRPESIEYLADGSLRLSYTDPGWDHVAHYRPRNKWGPRHIPVDQNAMVTLSVDAKGNFKLHIIIEGWPDMPVNVQFLLREDNTLILPCGSEIGLSHGGHRFSKGDRPCILIGPDGSRLTLSGIPPSEHHFVLGDGRTIGGMAEQRCYRFIAALFTPVNLTVTLCPEPGPGADE